MKTIKFIKMAGSGNDFLVVENCPKMIWKSIAIKMCDRTEGIGADGVLVCDSSKIKDFRMRIINSDGSEAEMCGNGARCMAAYIARFKKVKKQYFSLETLAGEIIATAKDELATVKLTNPIDYIPKKKIKINSRQITVGSINTGVPHVIVPVHNLEEINVKVLGSLIRYYKAFKPKGTNVNFVELIKNDLIVVRTYERGVEDETKACGTGSVASAIISYLNFTDNKQQQVNKAKMRVRTRGGEILQVCFDYNNGQIDNVWLKGSAKFIAKGEYYV